MEEMSFFGLMLLLIMLATGLKIRWYLMVAMVFGVTIAVFAEGTLTQLLGASFATISFILLLAGFAMVRKAREGEEQ